MPRPLALVPMLTVLLLLGPILSGLVGTLLPALGIVPGLEGAGISVDGFVSLFAWPGFGKAVTLSLTTGFATTLLSLVIVMLLVAGWSDSPMFKALERALSPLLSVPHAAAAFGLAFLIAPSGWIVRFIASVLPVWDRPPDLLILADPHGLSLILGLVIKEVPFLLLMTLAALGQVQPRKSVLVASALGYGKIAGWFATVFPRVYAQIRLPVYVVLAFSMSVVDIAVILGPKTPPTLSVQIIKWVSDPDLAQRVVAAAASIAQLGLTLFALVLWRLGEMAIGRLGRAWIGRGARLQSDAFLRALGLAAALLVTALMVLGLLSLALWSVAGLWSFPSLGPDSLTMRSWTRHSASVVAAGWNTAFIALAATLLATILVIGCLEAEYRHRRPLSRSGLRLIYLPLIVPQIAFLPGLQTGFLLIGADNGLLPVIFAHLVFVLPYVFLSLGDPWRAWDTRYGIVAAALGKGSESVLWCVRLPMLIRPALIAMAVGAAVSVGQYLPSLLIGGGRISTLTTEAVALASGADRRAIGVFALAQTIAALLPFALAIALPAWVMRNRKDVHG